jgi:predicted nicotinamide N-methyase
MAPETMPAAVAAVAASLAPGGSVLVRDYAAGDLAETRLAARGAAAGAASQKLGHNFYVRSDGTRSYYFSPDTLRDLFAQQGLACASLSVQERDITNRAQGVTMQRRWVQAVFTRGAGDADGGDAGEAAGEAEGLAATGGDLGLLFGGGSCGDGGEVRIVSAGRPLALQLLGREHQHTERATGAMLWEGSRALAEHLAATPHLVAGRRVVELGAGAAALPALAASGAGAAAVVATDGHPGVLRMLAANLARNGAGDAIPAQRLRWGHAGDCAAVRAGAPYDVALAADVVYDATALPQLFTTARQLLRGCPDALLLLCHVSDRGGVSHSALERAAAASGVTLSEEPLASSALAALEGAPPCRLLRGTLMKASNA